MTTLSLSLITTITVTAVQGIKFESKSYPKRVFLFNSL